MDRIAQTGLGAPAFVSSGGGPGGVAQVSKIGPSDRLPVGRDSQNGSVYARSRASGSAAESVEDIQRRSAEVIRSAIEEAGAAIDAGSKLVIRKDDDTGRFVYEFRNPQTDEVVKQFPAEEVLEAMARFRQAAAGKVVDRQA